MSDIKNDTSLTCLARHHPAKTLGELATHIPEQYKGLVALKDEQRQIEYQELECYVKPIAKALLAADISKGDRVAIWAPNSIDWVLSALAIHLCGAILVPLNTRMKGTEAAQILNESQCELVLCVGRFLSEDYPVLLDTDALSSKVSIVLLPHQETSAIRSTIPWLQWLSGGSRISDQVLAQRIASVDPDDTADILFTSGTTGKPKGAMCNHSATLNVYREYATQLDYRPDENYLIINPFFHAFGYKAGWVSALLAGCTILPEQIFEPGRIFERIAKDKVNILPGPPTLYTSLLNDERLASADLSSLRTAVTGSSSVSPTLVARMRKELGITQVVTAYGLTECGGVATMCSVLDSAEVIAQTSGRPLPNCELAILSPSNEKCSYGEIGEICVRGKHVMQGYWLQPEATKSAIDELGWLHTGDLGMLDADGNLHITGRLKDMFICGGFNCYPAEIEAIIETHPDVAHVAVIGVPDERMGEVGCAFVVAKNQNDIDEATFISWCRANMANYKAPRYVRQISKLPVNASNKVLKHELAALFG